MVEDLTDRLVELNGGFVENSQLLLNFVVY